MKKIILASSSPRRIEILRNLNLDFEIMPSNYEEVIIDSSNEELVKHLAYGKALDVSEKCSKNSIIIAADTMVFNNNCKLGKPKTSEEAYSMLKGLSGTVHEVMTGICLLSNCDNRLYLDHEVTSVYFKDLTEEEIHSYIASKEPMDKAGAYGIQGLGGLFVKRIEGCYFNVMGLPVYKLYNGLREMGVNLLLRDV